MDLYLTHRTRRPAPLSIALVAVLGMLVWVFTAQGRTAAVSNGSDEVAYKVDNFYALAIEDED
ncbi:MAG: hypothetical protein ACXWWO_06620, partial [Candidatus Limnocylindria bacterium]